MSRYVSKKRDARTTQRQYEMMLEFMIKHPDIASGRHANTKRANYEKHWEELAAVLNSDTAGPSKATTKWMKCWSDWKHNTRTKSAKIRQFKETPADGRFPCLLTSLEERLLKLMATFKSESGCDSFNWKQEGNDTYEYESQEIRNWFSANEFNIKTEDVEQDENSDTSDDNVQFNTVADFCIPVIAQEDGTGEPVPMYLPPGNWKKRKRLQSDESSRSHESQNLTLNKNDNCIEISGDASVKETLGRIADAVERSASATERCATACERIAHLCERVTTACERSASANETLVNAQERHILIQEKTVITTEQLQKTAERQAESCDQLVGIVSSVAEQSLDVLRKCANQNNIRR